jgi:hypothetical protein
MSLLLLLVIAGQLIFFVCFLYDYFRAGKYRMRYSTSGIHFNYSFSLRVRYFFQHLAS